MKYNRFEEVPVWQAGIDLAAGIFTVTEDKAFRCKGDIANQLQRAGLSVPNNIAEGFERGTTQELITFLYYARGSAGEVRSILCTMERIPGFWHLKSEISDFKSLAESVSRQLRAWADSLQNGAIEGQRYLTEKSKRLLDGKSRADAFVKKLKELSDAQHARRTEKRQSEISNLKSEISDVTSQNSGKP
mgnify:FL=1